MSALEVLVHPDPRLREIAESVKEIDAGILKMVNDMWETMYQDRGCGLAATQLGIKKRILVLDVSEKNNEPQCFINPEILETHGSSSLKQGCLSFPGIYLDIIRPEVIKVKYLNEHGQEKMIEADGFLSHALQHEIDHLNGVVFIDHLSRMKRERAMKKYFKELKLHNKVL